MVTNTINPLRILIVEDDCVNKMLLEKLLHKSSIAILEVESAETLAGAFELTKKIDFDIIFLDLNLPDSNGLETIVQTRQECPGSALIVVTGAYEDELGPKTIHCGAQEYLRKGKYDVELLSQTTRYALERKQNEKILKESEKKYRKLFEEAMDAIVITNAESGMIIDCNRAATELFGREKSELIAQHQRILYPAQEAERELTDSLEQHRGDKEGWVIKTQVINKDGRIRDVAVKVNTFELNDAEVTQRIFRDVTGFAQSGSEAQSSVACQQIMHTQN